MRVLLYDDGINSAEDATSEYGQEARTKCYSCRHEGQFGDFDELTSMINWVYFPKSSPPPEFGLSIVALFEAFADSTPPQL